MESERSNDIQEVDYSDEVEDDSPPPGFQSIIHNNNNINNPNLVDTDDDDEDDDGPPPGFGPLSPKAQLPLISSDKEKNGRLENVEDDEDDDGPPPGWEFNSLACALPKSPSVTTDIKREENLELNVDEDDDDGPPPGWEKVLPHQMPPPCVPQAQQSSNVSSDLQLRSKQDVVKNNDQEPQIVSDYNLIGQSSPPEPQVQQPQPSILLAKTEEKEEINVDEDDDDGPPPGWENVLPHEMSSPCVPQVQQSSKVSSDLQLGSKHAAAENNDKEPQIGSQYNLIPGQSSPHKPQQPQPPTRPGERGKGETRTRVKRPSTVKKPVSPSLLPPAPADTEFSTARSSSGHFLSPYQKRYRHRDQHTFADIPACVTNLAQLVCGACRKLCTYPRGAKLVQCPSCMEVNLAMEAHEIGQVKCNSCATLLMYPYGSPAVQCSSCRAVTEIGEHNSRAPLSVQQNQRRRHPNRAR